MTVRELLETFLASPHQWDPDDLAHAHRRGADAVPRPPGPGAPGPDDPQNTVEHAIARWVHAGASTALISAHFRILQSTTSWGVRNKLIISDSLDGMRTPSRPHPRLHLRPGQVHQLVVTTDDAVDKARARRAEQPNARQRMLDLFHAEQDALLIRLAADSGARRGELTALHTTDLQGRVLTIRRSPQDGVIGPVKNHLNGRLTLAASTANYWARHVHEWASYLNEEDNTGPQWLFRAAADKVLPLLPNGLGQRFEKLAYAAGHPDATLQRLRHIVGTYLVAQGKILQACARLRHRDVATTLRIYAHTLPLDDEDIADTLAELYGLTEEGECWPGLP